MQGNFIEDRGQPNPRQAEVDRLRDAAARSMSARSSRPAVVLDDVSIAGHPSPPPRPDAARGATDAGNTQAQA